MLTFEQNKSSEYGLTIFFNASIFVFKAFLCILFYEKKFLGPLFQLQSQLLVRVAGYRIRKPSHQVGFHFHYPKTIFYCFHQNERQQKSSMGLRYVVLMTAYALIIMVIFPVL